MPGLLEKVNFYNNILIANSTGGFPESPTSHSMYLVEVWVLHGCKFYNNKLIRGCFSTIVSRDCEWYYNYVDLSSASEPSGIGIEATEGNNARIHHNKIVGKPSAGMSFGIVIGVPDKGRMECVAHVWGNILHGLRGHVMGASGSGRDAKVAMYVFNNILDGAVEWDGLNAGQGKGCKVTLFVRNNIIANNHSYAMRAKGTFDVLEVDNNILYKNKYLFQNVTATHSVMEVPLYKDYARGDFRIGSERAPQVNAGVVLDSMYQWGLSGETYWGTATSEDLPRVVLKKQGHNGLRWEIGPYVYGQADSAKAD